MKHICNLPFTLKSYRIVVHCWLPNCTDWLLIGLHGQDRLLEYTIEPIDCSVYRLTMMVSIIEERVVAICSC